MSSYKSCKIWTDEKKRTGKDLKTLQSQYYKFYQEILWHKQASHLKIKMCALMRVN